QSCASRSFLQIVLALREQDRDRLFDRRIDPALGLARGLALAGSLHRGAFVLVHGTPAVSCCETAADAERSACHLRLASALINLLRSLESIVRQVLSPPRRPSSRTTWGCARANVTLATRVVQDLTILLSRRPVFSQSGDIRATWSGSTTTISFKASAASMPSSESCDSPRVCDGPISLSQWPAASGIMWSIASFESLNAVLRARNASTSS